MPGQSGYLILQISRDQQSLYVAYCQVTKDRKFNYFVDKLQLTVEKREYLASIVKDLAQLKISMMKTPITIQEDLQALEQSSERELNLIVQRMEKFFAPIAQSLSKIISPEVVEEEREALNASAMKKDPAATKKVEEAKQAKQPPPK